MPKRKSHFMNSALSIPRTFSPALDTFLVKTSCSFLPHLSNLTVRNNSQSFFLAHAQDIVGIIAILLFFRSCFRPEVSLSIIVKCNGNRLGQSDRDRDRK